MALHLGDVPLKRRKMHTPLNGLYIPFFKDLLSISKENKNLRQLVAEVW